MHVWSSNYMLHPTSIQRQRIASNAGCSPSELSTFVTHHSSSYLVGCTTITPPTWITPNVPHVPHSTPMFYCVEASIWFFHTRFTYVHFIFPKTDRPNFPAQFPSFRFSATTSKASRRTLRSAKLCKICTKVAWAVGKHLEVKLNPLEDWNWSYKFVMKIPDSPFKR